MPQPQPPLATGKAIADYVDGQVGGYVNVGNIAATKTLDLGLGATQRVVLTASAPAITITAANGKPTGVAQKVRLLLVQDGTGSRLLPTFTPALNYGVAGAPTLSTGANKIDVLDLMSLDGGTTWLCTAVAKGF